MLAVADNWQTQRPGEVSDQSLIVVVGDRRQYGRQHRVALDQRRRTRSAAVDGRRVAGAAAVRAQCSVRGRAGVADVAQRRRRRRRAVSPAEQTPLGRARRRVLVGPRRRRRVGTEVPVEAAAGRRRRRLVKDRAVHKTEP